MKLVIRYLCQMIASLVFLALMIYAMLRCMIILRGLIFLTDEFSKQGAVSQVI